MRLFILTLSIFVVSISLLQANSSLVLACSNNNSPSTNLALKGANELGSSCSGKNLTSSGGLVASVINILSYIAGVIVLFMVIFAGFRYISSAGDANKVNSAKNTLLYAIVGIVIIILAQVIVHFVITST